MRDFVTVNEAFLPHIQSSYNASFPWAPIGDSRARCWCTWQLPSPAITGLPATSGGQCERLPTPTNHPARSTLLGSFVSKIVIKLSVKRLFSRRFRYGYRRRTFNGLSHKNRSSRYFEWSNCQAHRGTLSVAVGTSMVDRYFGPEYIQLIAKMIPEAYRYWYNFPG